MRDYQSDIPGRGTCTLTKIEPTNPVPQSGPPFGGEHRSYGRVFFKEMQ